MVPDHRHLRRLLLVGTQPILAAQKTQPQLVTKRIDLCTPAAIPFHCCPRNDYLGWKPEQA
jgi:hypothetical protein